tara:strand:+ start:732 stop:3734 length:3003 start_codon:yes stop_codon:yes gene_type:complete
VKQVFEGEIRTILRGETISNFSLDTLFVFLFYLYKHGGRFLVLGDNALVSECIKRKHFFYNVFYSFPEEEQGTTVPGFETQKNLHRSEALIKLTENKNGVCFSTNFVANQLLINKKTVFKKSALSIGLVKDRDVFCEELSSFGYKKVDYVYNHCDFSMRGDVVDVFPQHKNKPIRVLFNFKEVEQISFFDIDDQRSIKNLESFVFYDLFGGLKDSGKSIFNFFNWDFVLKVDKENGVYTLNKRGAGVDPFLIRTKNFKVTKKLSSLLLKKPNTKEVVVFYQNQKRKNKITSLGYTPVRGHIENAFRLRETVFVPDRKKKKINYLEYKHNKNNSLSQLKIGDLMVHVSHGVGKFGGLVVRGPDGYEKEYIKLTYKEGGVLYVPINKSDLIHRYIGIGGRSKLNKLGGKEWSRDVSKTKKELELVSDALVDIYHSRNKPRGFRYKKSVDFEKAIKESFPFKETKDQKKAIQDVLSDLSNKEPMDRLLCGDVGFGKTEVALRAIVRVVSFSKQVALLCPTTVLSDQHYITAKERLEPLGISVALLSRFQTKKEQSRVLMKIVNGSVGLIVGTHRLLSDDVVIPFLGLLIIDEEHRFGVRHKEKIRALKAKMDVLSMSATPIPRTLQQSLLGIRDISRIETPPTTRKPINTHVEFFSWKRTQQIIEKETIRGGQTYFLHNKVESIEYYVRKIQELFPNERVDFIHGQQNSKDLEQNLLDFFDGKISILVCSTIIESGLDVSNANCMIINNPQDLGLSQLYQIRGRVGRGSRQADCHLFIPKKTKLSEKAYKRLKTIERHTSLGSGYHIATNDLDIRGGGAVFGYKQSGEISRVGLEHYNSILKTAVSKKLNKPIEPKEIDISFFGKSLIPIYYVLGETERFSFYTKINNASTLGNIKDVEEELIDRFGGKPQETTNFLNLAKLRILFKKTFVIGVYIKETSVSIVLDSEVISDNFINSVLMYKDDNIKDRKFKENKEGFVVDLIFPLGFDWYENISNSINLFKR